MTHRSQDACRERSLGGTDSCTGRVLLKLDVCRAPEARQECVSPTPTPSEFPEQGQDTGCGGLLSCALGTSARVRSTGGPLSGQAL